MSAVRIVIAGATALALAGCDDQAADLPGLG